MESHCACVIANDTVEDFNDLQRFDFETGFFKNLAPDALRRAFVS